jgi:AcrR family transcriptional regulator
MHQRIHQRILDHVESQLLEQGYKCLRVDELARAAGISKRTLYEQFQTKEDMACEALARRLARLEQGIAKVTRRSAAPTDEVAQLRVILTLICRAEAQGRPAFHRDVQTTPALAGLVVVSRRRCVARLDAVIRSGIQSGRFRGDLDARLVRRALLGAVAAIVQPQLRSEPRLSPDQASTAILDVILNGVAAV